MVEGTTWRARPAAHAPLLHLVRAQETPQRRGRPAAASAAAPPAEPEGRAVSTVSDGRTAEGEGEVGLALGQPGSTGDVEVTNGAASGCGEQPAAKRWQQGGG